MDATTILPFIAQQGAKIAALEAEIAAFKATPPVSAGDATRIATLEATVAMKQTINDELNAKNEMQEAQIKNLLAQVEAAKAIEAQLAEAQAKIAEQTAQLAVATAENEANKNKLALVEARFAELEGMVASAPTPEPAATAPAAITSHKDEMVETKLQVEKPPAVATPSSPPAFRVFKTKTYNLSQATTDPDTLLRVAKAFAFTRNEKNRKIKIDGKELGDIISHLFMFRANKTNGKVIPFFQWIGTNIPELTEEGESLIPWLVESEDERDIKAVAAFNKFLNTNKDFMKA